MTLVQYLFETGLNGQTVSNGTSMTASNSGSSAASVGGGAHTFATAKVAHGSLGGQFVNVAGTLTFRRWSLAAANTVWQFSGVVTLPGSSVGGNVTIASFGNASGTSRASIYFNAAGAICAQDIGAAHTLTLATSADGVTLGSKYRVTLVCTGGSTTASTITAKVYSGTTSWTTQIGTTQTASNWNMGTDQVTAVDLGVMSYVTAVATVGWDDIQFNDGAGTEIGDYVLSAPTPSVSITTQDTYQLAGLDVALSGTASISGDTISTAQWEYMDDDSDGAFTGSWTTLTTTGTTTATATNLAVPAGVRKYRLVITGVLGGTNFADTYAYIYPVADPTGATGPAVRSVTNTGAYVNAGGSPAANLTAAMNDGSAASWAESPSAPTAAVLTLVFDPHGPGDITLTPSMQTDVSSPTISALCTARKPDGTALYSTTKSPTTTNTAQPVVLDAAANAAASASDRWALKLDISATQ